MNNIKLYQKLGQVVQYSRSELVTFYFDFVRKMWEFYSSIRLI